MAGMKRFYAGLGAIAVVGGGAIWWTSLNAASIVPIGPIPVEAISGAKGYPGHAVGSDSAPVEVIEYADFQCPACQSTWLLTIQDLKERLVKTGQVRYVFRDFPLEIHDKSRIAHHAAACADEQGAFWQMHDQLYSSQAQWSAETGPVERRFRDYAEQLGLNVSQYDDCMASGRFRARIQASVDNGTALGVTSTPTFIIGNQRYPGMTYDQLKHVVDSVAAAR
jgi:protein-disulfide isomerase